MLVLVFCLIFLISFIHDLLNVTLNLARQKIGQLNVKTVLESESSCKLLRIVPLKYVDTFLLAIANIDSDSQQFIHHLSWLLVLRLILDINVILIARSEVLSDPIINKLLLAINNSL
jgi:hypothetical protein